MNFQQNQKKLRVSKQQPSTEIYNITIEGGEDRIEYAEGEETKTRIVEDPNSLSISSEIKTGSDSSSELPDDVKGKSNVYSYPSQKPEIQTISYRQAYASGWILVSICVCLDIDYMIQSISEGF